MSTHVLQKKKEKNKFFETKKEQKLRSKQLVEKYKWNWRLANKPGSCHSLLSDVFQHITIAKCWLITNLKVSISSTFYAHIFRTKFWRQKLQTCAKLFRTKFWRQTCFCMKNACIKYWWNWHQYTESRLVFSNLFQVVYYMQRPQNLRLLS